MGFFLPFAVRPSHWPAEGVDPWRGEPTLSTPAENNQLPISSHLQHSAERRSWWKQSEAKSQVGEVITHTKRRYHRTNLKKVQRHVSCWQRRPGLVLHCQLRLKAPQNVSSFCNKTVRGQTVSFYHSQWILVCLTLTLVNFGENPWNLVHSHPHVARNVMQVHLSLTVPGFITW